MANWQGAILTNAGIALQARVEAGETKLNLTKLKLGDGTPASLETMTDLSSPKQVVGITSITPNDDGTIVVNGTVSNTGLTEGYYLREYGLFAKDDSNNEVLYCVSVDTNPDYLQPEGSATTISEELGLTIAVSNTADITVNVTSVGMASMLDLNNHNSGADSHPNGLTHPLMDWVASYLYKVGDVRVYNKKIWRCKTANSDAVFDEAKWDLLGGGDYLPLAGGTMTGAIGFDGTTKTLGVTGDDVTWGGKEIKGMAFPSSTSVDIPLAGYNTSTIYTAPADGYVYSMVRNSLASQSSFSLLTLSSSALGVRCVAISSNHALAFIPVSKGEKVSIAVDNCNTGYAHFVYAEGEV